jgi:hypothetical protein
LRKSCGNPEALYNSQICFFFGCTLPDSCYCDLAYEAGTPFFFAFLVASGVFHCERAYEAGTPFFIFACLRLPTMVGSAASP